MTESLAISLLLVVFIVELFLRAHFSSAYFKFGIPVFQKSVEVADSLAPLPYFGSISQKSVESDFYVYKLGQVDSVSVGVKEPYPIEFFGPGFSLSWGSRYTPVLRAIIVFEESSKSVLVRAHLNWFVLPLFVLMLVGVGVEDPIDLVFHAGVVSILVVISMVQINLYKHLLNGAVIAWSTRDHSFTPSASPTKNSKND